jgi:Subtilase family
MNRTRRTRAFGLALSVAIGIGVAGGGQPAGAQERSEKAGGGMTVREGDNGSECYYRPAQLIAPPGLASEIARVTDTSVKETGSLVPEELIRPLPDTVQRYSVYSIGGADPLLTAATLEQGGISAAPNYVSAFAPVRTWAPGEDARPLPGPVPAIARSSHGAGLRLGVLDTGLNTKLPWLLRGRGTVTYRSAASVRNVLEADGLIAPSYVQPTELATGRAAGHGTFITGLMRRAVPGANLVVAQVPFYDSSDASFGVDPVPGVYSVDTSSRSDDAALAFMMLTAFVEAGPKTNIDVLSLSFGSYGCNEAIEPQFGPGEFRTPIGLRSALLGLWELSGRQLRVAAAAGNDQTDEPFYPAAFAAVSCFDPANVPPSSPPKCEVTPKAVSPWLAGVSSPPSSLGDYSNRADWAVVEADGSDVASVLGNLNWASWSGTSFAAPCATVTAALKGTRDWADLTGTIVDCGLGRSPGAP